MHSNHVKPISMNDPWNIKTIFISNNNNLRRWITTTTQGKKGTKWTTSQTGKQKNCWRTTTTRRKNLLKWTNTNDFYYCFDSSGFWIFSSFSTFQFNPLHSIPLHTWSIYGFLACVVETFPFPFPYTIYLPIWFWDFFFIVFIAHFDAFVQFSGSKSSFVLSKCRFKF